MAEKVLAWEEGRGTGTLYTHTAPWKAFCWSCEEGQKNLKKGRPGETFGWSAEGLG
jgi:hypothetical protein